MSQCDGRLIRFSHRYKDYMLFEKGGGLGPEVKACWGLVVLS